MKKLTSLFLALCMSLVLLCTTGCSLNDLGELGDAIEDLLGGIFEGIGGGDDGDDLGAEGRDEFIEGLGGVSDTFTGVVSTESFDTAADAAEAYVATEIVGDSQAVVLGTNVVNTLSDREIGALNIPDEMQNGIVGVEELEVSYMINAPVAYALSTKSARPADTLNESKTVHVYVIKYETNWKYFSPAPITGDTITRSYYDSVFNAAKYKNCTLNTTMTLNVEMTGSENGTPINMTMTMNMSQLIKHADGKVYLEQRVSSSGMGESTSQTIYAYMETVEGSVVCYVKLGEDSTEWMRTTLSTIGFSTLDELTPFYDQYLDYTYFTKTNYGFKLSDDNAKQYLNEAFAEAGIFDILDSSDMSLAMFAEYYVSDGVLSGMRMDADITFEVTQGMSSVTAIETVDSTTTCTNYGTTVVEKPFTE